MLAPSLVALHEGIYVDLSVMQCRRLRMVYIIYQLAAILGQKRRVHR